MWQSKQFTLTFYFLKCLCWYNHRSQWAEFSEYSYPVLANEYEPIVKAGVEERSQPGSRAWMEGRAVPGPEIIKKRGDTKHGLYSPSSLTPSQPYWAHQYFHEVQLIDSSLLHPLPSGSLNTQHSLRSSALCPRETWVLLSRKLHFSFPLFPFIIWVMVTTSEPFLPGDCSMVCRKLFTGKKDGIYQNICDLDLKNH